jgi:hypothetical protein
LQVRNLVQPLICSILTGLHVVLLAIIHL